jgi:hypothetical protein
VKQQWSRLRLRERVVNGKQANVIRAYKHISGDVHNRTVDMVRQTSARVAKPKFTYTLARI